MRRRRLLALLASAAALRPALVRAQQPKGPTIGVLVIGGPLFRTRLGLFEQELADLGHVDGENLRVETRSANGDLARLPGLAAELVRRDVDVIVAYATPSVLAAQRATHNIPIVMVGSTDPVGAGLVASFAHPGGNITGLAVFADLLTEKSVGLLKEAVPSLRRIAALCNAPDPFGPVMLDHAGIAATAQQIDIVPFTVTSGPELDAAFPAMLTQKVEAVIVQPTLPARHVADLAIKSGLPSAAPASGFAHSGGLISYAASPEDIERSAAVFVDKILSGAKPADLPVEQLTKFELVVNLKTAQALNLTVPPGLLNRADEVIE
jgi:putative ABC transport system substrate-binding protein